MNPRNLLKIAPLLALVSLAGCSTSGGGSSGGNPEVAVKLRISQNSVTSDSVSALSLCASHIRFVPSSSSSAPIESDLAPSDLSVSPAGNPLASVSLPIQNYQRVELDLANQCVSQKSVQLTNSSGSFAISGQTSLVFKGDFSVSSTMTDLGLQIQPVVDQLASVSSNTTFQSVISNVSGALSPAYSAGINLEVPIDLLDFGVSSDTSPIAFGRSQTSLNTLDYDGTVSYVFEVVADNLDLSARNVRLLNASGTAVASIPVAMTGSNSNPTRFVTGFVPTAGPNIYRIQLDATSSADQLVVYSGRILVRQSGATRTRIYVPLMAGISRNGSHLDSSIFTDQTNSTTYSQADAGWYSLWKKNNAAFKQITGTNPWTFEAVLSATGGSAYASLFDASTGLQVNASEVSTTAAVPSLVTADFADNAASFNDQDNMEVQIKATGGVGQIYRGGIWIRLTSVNHAEVYYRDSVVENWVAGANAMDSQNRRMELDTSWFSQTTQLFHDFVGTGTSSAVCTVSLFDNGVTDSGVTGSIISGSSLSISSTALTLQRTPALSVPSGHRLSPFISGNPSPGSCGITSAFVVVAF